MSSRCNAGRKPAQHEQVEARFVRRSGRVNSLWLLLLGAGALIVFLSALLTQNAPRPGTATEQPSVIRVLCAAGMRAPMEKIARQYEEEFQIAVDLQFGGSNTLLNQLEINTFDTADLYLAADQAYTDQAVAKGLAAETLPIATIRPVLVVRKGNPSGLSSLDDLLQKEGLTLSVPDPEQAAVGKAVRDQLQSIAADRSSRWDQLEQRVQQTGVFKPTVNETATDVKLGAADAGMIWDFLAQSPGYRDELDVIDIPELKGSEDVVSLAVLHSSRQPTAALKFARYLTARDRGLQEFQNAGLNPVDGDVWAERPSITFFCGSVNRNVVDRLIEEFSEREGVEVKTIYDGCGTLTGRMKTIDKQQTELGFPDVYMACDRYYLENVAEWFQDAANVSSAEIVLVVPKGSQKVRSLADLIQPGVRVAVGEPDQCTIGALTRRMLASEGLYDKLKQKQNDPAEVVVEKPSSALLVPDVVAGHVDAAIAYITDTRGSTADIDVVHIDSAQNLAIQPLSIARTSQHKALVRRLYNRITGSPEAFQAAGFQYQFEPSLGKAGGQ